MLVSVLVPVYGVEKYIERCAVSLFEQTYRDIEYVFVNDCTPDRSIDILRAVAGRYPAREAQMRIIDNPRNLGVGATRAAAIAAATGDCLIHVDSDDYVTPQAIELLCRKMEATGADMVDGAWQRVTAEGPSAPQRPYRGADEKVYLSLLLCQNIVSNRMWGRLFRRSLYTEHGITLVPGIDFCEDYSVMVRLMFFARRAFIDDVVYMYSDENASSYTHTASDKHVRSFLKSNALVLDFFRRHDSDGRYLFPLQVGLINVERNIRRVGFDRTEADRLLPYRAEGFLFRLLRALFRSRCPYKAAEAMYLAVRRLYVMCLTRGRAAVREL